MNRSTRSEPVSRSGPVCCGFSVPGQWIVLGSLPEQASTWRIPVPSQCSLSLSQPDALWSLDGSRRGALGPGWARKAPISASLDATL